MHESPGPSPATRVPSLGPRGEGWVAIQVVLYVVVVAACALGPAWGEPWLSVGQLAGTVLGAAGVGMVALGVRGLRRNLTAVPRPVAGGQLVDTGVYGLVRHPIYTGGIAVAFGLALATASPAALVAAAGLAVFFDLKSRHEETWLLETYPGYAGYRCRVRKLIPFIY